MNEIPRYLNNGYGVVPNLPGNGRFDAQETANSKMFSALGSLAGLIPGVGGILSTGMNLIGMHIQNKEQERMYQQYQSPQARMQQMVAAGINPNTAAQGIAGSAAPSMQAANAPDMSGLGEQVGNSVNNALQAELMKSEIQKNEADASLIDSRNTGQQIANVWANKEHAAALRKLVADGEISKANAKIIGADAEYAEANAYEKFQQTMMNTQIMVQELQNMQQEYVNMMAQYDVMLSQIGVNQAERAKIFSDIGVNNAMIGKINAETSNVMADTALAWQTMDMNRITNDINKVTLAFKQDVLKTMQLYGYRDDLSVQGNYMRMIAQGRRDDADRLMSDTYQYVTGATTTGKYASQDNARKWISNITGAVMTVGGVIMMATGAGAVPGAALTGAGLTTMSKGNFSSGNRPIGNSYDTYDFSHLPQ